MLTINCGNLCKPSFYDLTGLMMPNFCPVISKLIPGFSEVEKTFLTSVEVSLLKYHLSR